MRVPVIAFALLVVTLSVNSVSGDGIGIGDSVERVRDVLGPPDGYIKSGTYELLVYDRGRIEAREGVVTKASLLTVEDAAAARAERERLRLVRVEAEKRRQEQRVREGERVRDATFADPAFLARSAGDQLAFWKGFARNYPGVEIDEAYRAELIARHTQDLRAAETEQRFRAMESRVAAAEARAEQAERDASEARRRSRSYTDYGYPVARYGTPVVVSPTPYYSHSSAYGPVRTTTRSSRTTTVGPCTGRAIFNQNKPYVYSPSTSWLRCRSNPSVFETRSSGVNVRAKVSF